MVVCMGFAAANVPNNQPQERNSSFKMVPQEEQHEGHEKSFLGLR